MKTHATIPGAAVLCAFLVLAFLAPVASAQNYMVLGEGNQISAETLASIEAAGGVVARTIDQVGIACATSADPDFLGNVSGRAGVQLAIPDVKTQVIDPPVAPELISAEFSDPPTSGDDDFFFDLQWGHDAVNSPEAWNAGYRGAGVRVAILDSGIDADHPDLAPNLNTALSTSFVPGEGFDIAPGLYFNHGTHVSGIVGAADNAYGTIGIAPEAELVAIKVLSEFTGSGDFSWLIDALVYAADHDVDVVNMSLGALLPKGGNLDKVQQDIKAMLEVATQYAHDHGVTLIASAGNSAADLDAGLIHLPSDAKHVISISASAPVGWAVDPSTNLDNPASYTNYGANSIDFAAPGGDFVYPGSEDCTVGVIIPITRPCWVFDLAFSTVSEGWGWAAGTSMAAPHAAGVAAIIIGKHGGSMNPDNVRKVLKASSDKLGAVPGNDAFFGQGRVNAYKAVVVAAQQTAPDAGFTASLQEAVPDRFALKQNYPNPFNPATAITFALPEQSTVRLAIYDLLGREVRVLAQGLLPAGEHQVTFEAADLPSGPYFYRLVTPKGTFTRQMVLMK